MEDICKNCGKEFQIANGRIRLEREMIGKNGERFEIVCSFMCGFALRKKLNKEYEKYTKKLQNRTKGKAGTGKTRRRKVPGI